ncbi:hypothetical protein [Mastigocoleus sp. MO_188.B34]|uniref:hypothetical protein n=1 Tax=Mastigocoleus sp. MO_188.B34 TaxID=3036635 RepID=UPI00262276C9|nr:hypothetical protein [Mastigocoleus sp. MO_188.B34]MDJ0696927.1 hypothetical protein [Mastigocoleus sp. MO_188.B34]
MSQEFSEYELEQISKLPMDIALLANKYRIDVLNAAEVWGKPPFYKGYKPEIIDIYYGNIDTPNVFILNGELKEYNISSNDEKSKSLSVMFDGQWAYIQVEKTIIINRLGGVILPEVIVEPSALIQSILNTGN